MFERCSKEEAKDLTDINLLSSKVKNFEFGKQYIVNVTQKGIFPVMEFDSERFFDKEEDDISILTDEEKKFIVNDIVDKIIDRMKDLVDVEKRAYGKENWRLVNKCIDIAEQCKRSYDYDEDDEDED